MIILQNDVSTTIVASPFFYILFIYIDHAHATSGLTMTRLTMIRPTLAQARSHRYD